MGKYGHEQTVVSECQSFFFSNFQMQNTWVDLTLAKSWNNLKNMAESDTELKLILERCEVAFF